MTHVRIDIPDVDVRPDVIREALAGRVAKLPPSVALSLISDLQIPDTEQQSLLQEVVQDSKLQPHVRAGAVRHYMRAGAKIAGPALLKLLESPEERVAAAAALALGQIGNAEDIPALEKAQKGDLLRRRAAFAKALIVHRLGIADQVAELPAVKSQAAPIVGALNFTSVRPGHDRRNRALQAIKREFPLVDSGKHDVYELQCGPRLMEIAIDRSFIGTEVATLKQKPALPAIIAFQSVEYDEFYPRLIALSRPKGKEKVTLTLTTLTGDVVYFGDGSVNQGGAEFELHSAERPGVTAIAARVVITARGVNVNGVSSRVAAPADTPSKHKA